MNVNALETLFWRLNASQQDADRFRQDRDAFMSEFRLTDEEKQAVRGLDVKGLHESGVSCLLLMMACSRVNGFDKMGEYMAAMAGGDLPSDASVGG